MSINIISDGWGEITIQEAGKTTKYKDCILTPYGSSDWNWSTNNTHHRPGIQVADLCNIPNIYQYLRDQETIVLLSQGRDGVLETTPELLEYLKTNNIEYLCGRTDKIIAMYKKLIANKKKVIALIHTTC